MWDQLYPTLIACVEYIAYEFRKSFQLTSPHNNHWFIVLEKWNNRFSVWGQSLRGFIGFFHLSNNFALFWFHSIVYTTKLFFVFIIHKANKEYFPFLLVTLYWQIPGQARLVLTTVAWTSQCYAQFLFFLLICVRKKLMYLFSWKLFFFPSVFLPLCCVSAHKIFKIKSWTPTTRGYGYSLFFPFSKLSPFFLHHWVEPPTTSKVTS